jgi:hypothetical protein
VVFEWCSRFKAGQVPVEDDEYSGWQSTSKTIENVKKFWERIHKDHRWTIHELADTVGISYAVCQILTEKLNMHHTATQFVPLTLDKWSKAAAHKRVSWAMREG